MRISPNQSEPPPNTRPEALEGQAQHDLIIKVNYYRQKFSPSELTHN